MSSGTLGNANLGNYLWRPLYSYGTDYNTNNGSFPSQPGNHDLTWEKLWKSNIGLDLGINHRFNARFDLYYNITSDMLFPVPYSWTSGFSIIWDNVGKMRNSGVEASLNYIILNSQDFQWEISGNVSYNNNKVLELYGEKTEIESNNTIVKEGLPIGTFYMVRYAGVNPANGRPLWYTKDGELTDEYSESNRVILDDKQSIGPINGGLSSSMEYKGINLSFFFTYVHGKYMLNNTRYFTESNGQFSSYNQTTRVT